MKSEYIYTAELADYGVRLVGAESARNAVLAYLLLGQRLIVHPAYVFQSDEARYLVLGAGALGASDVSLAMSEIETVGDYLADRIVRLADAAQSDPAGVHDELSLYDRRKANLAYECEALDSRFPMDCAHHVMNWSRDARFRQLIAAELDIGGRLGNHLFALLGQCAGFMPERQMHSAMRRLIDYLCDPALLVSVDTVLNFLVARGWERAQLRPVVDRLHYLHWRSNQGMHIRVPLLSLRMYARLDPYDPGVFWIAASKLLGEDLVRELRSLPTVDAVALCRDLRADGTWRRFLAAYCDIVDTIDVETNEFTHSDVIRSLSKRYPPRASFTWRATGKLAMLSVACGLIAVASGAVFGSVAGVAGAMATGATVAQLINAWRAAAARYAESDRSDLQSRLRSALRRVRLEVS